MTREPDGDEFQPQVDDADICVFVDVVFGYLEGFVPVRILAEKGTATARPISNFHAIGDRLSESLIADARRAARLGRALFVVPATVATAGSAGTRDIVQTGVIPVDLDSGDVAAKRDHLVRHLGPPTLEVASGGVTDEGQSKLHLYWRLTEAAAGEDLTTVAKLRGTIAEKAGGDTAFNRIHQPIRVAGSVHGKHGVKSRVRILERREHEYDLTEFAAAVSAMPSLADPNPGFRFDTGAGNRGPSVEDLMKRVIRDGGVDGINRFEAISKVAGHLIRQARLGLISIEEAWNRLLNYNGNNIAPPWPEERMHREFDALLKRDRVKNAEAWAARQARPQDDDTILPPVQSDDALAAAFVPRFGLDWIHVPVWGRWLHWTGWYWAEDETRRFREIVRQSCRAQAVQQEKAGDARRIASAKTMAAVERILASDPALARAADSLDRNPMLLNSTAGIIDLETGEIAPHARAELITRHVEAKPQGTCPLWLSFVAEITAGDVDLAAYLQRVCGYCLTGSTGEQVFFFLHGHGANGKSVFLQVLATILGDYSASAALETFMTSQYDRHSTDLAGLRGARLVAVTETEPGRTWAESRIKAITGGDTIRARFLYHDNFEFQPSFKLMVAGNHRPALNSLGEAMRRRLHLIPFNVTIPPERRDGRLAEKLKTEVDGILAWMLEGCADWQRIGLRPPAVVRAAADAYFADEDIIGAWIAERCQVGPEYRASSTALFASWKAHAESCGYPVRSAKVLGEALRERGFLSCQVHRARGWAGIGLRGAGGVE